MILDHFHTHQTLKMETGYYRIKMISLKYWFDFWSFPSRGQVGNSVRHRALAHITRGDLEYPVHLATCFFLGGDPRGNPRGHAKLHTFRKPSSGSKLQTLKLWASSAIGIAHLTRFSKSLQKCSKWPNQAARTPRFPYANIKNEFAAWNFTPINFQWWVENISEGLGDSEARVTK